MICQWPWQISFGSELSPLKQRTLEKSNAKWIIIIMIRTLITQKREFQFKSQVQLYPLGMLSSFKHMSVLPLYCVDLSWHFTHESCATSHHVHRARRFPLRLVDTLDTTQRDRRCSWASRCRRSAGFVTLNSHKELHSAVRTYQFKVIH